MNECLDSRDTRFCHTLIIGGCSWSSHKHSQAQTVQQWNGSQWLFALCFLFSYHPIALLHLLVICWPHCHSSHSQQRHHGTLLTIYCCAVLCHCVQLCVFLSSYLYGNHLALLQSHTVSSTAGTVIPSLWVLQGWVGVVPKALRWRREIGWGGVDVSERSTDLALPDLWSYGVVVWLCRTSYTVMQSTQSGGGSTGYVKVAAQCLQCVNCSAWLSVC